MTRKIYPSDKDAKYIVRMPDGLRPFIKKKAAKACRSMNAEIIYRLQQAYGLNEKGLEASKHETAS